MAALANAKHEAFARAIVEGKGGAQAYRAAGYTAKAAAAKANASRLLTNANVAARVAELKNAAAETVKITAERVFDELAKIGFANTQDYFTANDAFVGMSKLTRDQAAALQSLEIERQLIKVGRGKKAVTRIVNKVKFKLHDKRGALVDLGKHFGLFTPKDQDPDKSGAGDERPLSDLEAARRIAFLLSKAAREQPPGKTGKT